MDPEDKEHGLPMRLVKFRLFRAAQGNHEVARVQLCSGCAVRLSRAIWAFIDKGLVVMLPGDREHAEPGGVM